MHAKALSLSFPRFKWLHRWYGQDERSIWTKFYHRIKMGREIVLVQKCTLIVQF